MTPRAAKIAPFLDAHGWASARRAPLAGDASNRRYERLTDGPDGQGAVLMDAPPEKGEKIAPFVQIAQHLSALGFSAPRIIAQDREAGLLLIEDLGDALYARIIAEGRAEETKLYTAAVDLLVELHRHPPPDWIGPYDVQLMAEKAALAGQWYLGGSTAEPAPFPDHPGAHAVHAAILPLLEAHANETSVLIQRDYHAENLIWLPERDGSARVGLLDFQDALVGHPSYDLASLLEDARRDVPRALQQEMIAHYTAARGLKETRFRRAYALLAAQRNLRILGVFSRLSLHFGKTHYIALIPRVWAHLMHDLSHPDLAPLQHEVLTWLPPPDLDVLNRLTDRCATIPKP
ncbi:MAG: phosphotransferase [Pseudomonadota bacterium]